MPFLKRPSARRRVFLSLISDIERDLRAAFVRWSKENNGTQSSLAKILGINRSAVHRRLTGRANLTIETIADMVWALGYCIHVDIFHPKDAGMMRNQALISVDGVPALVPPTLPTANNVGPPPLYKPAQPSVAMAA
jgi:DNA-binding phage protein